MRDGVLEQNKRGIKISTNLSIWETLVSEDRINEPHSEEDMHCP